MSTVLLALLAASVVTNQPANFAPMVAGAPTNSAAVIDTNSPVEREYQAVLEEDDAAQEALDRWIRDNQEFAGKGAGIPPQEMRQRIRERLAPIKKRYQEFLQRHPDHARGHMAFASFLGDLGDEDGARAENEKALALDPTNPAVYNNLADLYTHGGPIKKAFEYYAKAIELNPREPLYYHNLGTVVYLFRKDAQEAFGLNEEQVYAKAFALYSNAMRLDPDNFPLATDVAQTYYGIRPLRTEQALNAWTNALRIAHDEVDREGVYLHLARVKLLAGRFSEAQAHLDAVTNQAYAELKNKLQRNLEERRNQAQSTNAPPQRSPP